MKKLELKCWAIFLIPLLLLLLATSCKSRDVNKTTKKETLEVEKVTKSTQESADNSKEVLKEVTNQETKKESQTATSSTSFKLTPVDKDKPIILEDAEGNQTKISNAVFESVDSKTNTQKNESTSTFNKKDVEIQNDIKNKSNSSGIEVIKASSEASDKSIKSKPISFFSISLFLLIAIVIWFVYRKIKNLDWKTVFKN